nr:hypothetical protein [Tanacetum cinerariifolium]
MSDWRGHGEEQQLYAMWRCEHSGQETVVKILELGKKLHGFSLAGGGSTIKAALGLFAHELELYEADHGNFTNVILYVDQSRAIQRVEIRGSNYFKCYASMQLIGSKFGHYLLTPKSTISKARTALDKNPAEHARTAFAVDPRIAFSLGPRFPTNTDLKTELSLSSDNQNDDDVYVGLEKDEYNDVMAKVVGTLDDAYMFYNGYALLHGFGIHIHTTCKNKVTNEAYGRKFVCNKEGFKDLKGKAPDGGVKKWRRDLRTGCEAFLRINISKDRKWFVKEFKNAHNHELTVTPTKVMKHRSHGKFHRSMACKSLMSELSHSGLKPSHIKKVVNSMKNPLEPDVTSKQCADVLSDERK